MCVCVCRLLQIRLFTYCFREGVATLSSSWCSVFFTTIQGRLLSGPTHLKWSCAILENQIKSILRQQCGRVSKKGSPKGWFALVSCSIPTKRGVLHFGETFSLRNMSGLLKGWDTTSQGEATGQHTIRGVFGLFLFFEGTSLLCFCGFKGIPAGKPPICAKLCGSFCR